MARNTWNNAVAPADPQTGDILWNSALSVLQVWDGSAWTSALAGSFAPLTNPTGGLNNYLPIAGPTYTGTLAGPTLSLSGDATVGGNLVVTGTTSLTGNVTFANNLTGSPWLLRGLTGTWPADNPVPGAIPTVTLTATEDVGAAIGVSRYFDVNAPTLPALAVRFFLDGGMTVGQPRTLTEMMRLTTFAGTYPQVDVFASTVIRGPLWAQNGFSSTASATISNAPGQYIVEMFGTGSDLPGRPFEADPINEPGVMKPGSEGWARITVWGKGGWTGGGPYVGQEGWSESVIRIGNDGWLLKAEYADYAASGPSRVQTLAVGYDATPVFSGVTHSPLITLDGTANSITMTGDIVITNSLTSGPAFTNFGGTLTLQAKTAPPPSPVNGMMYFNGTNLIFRANNTWHTVTWS